MSIKIINYENELDKKILQVFYKSTFYNRKEFEYVRVPKRWITRYKNEKESIQKIAVDNEKVVATLGGIIYEGNINTKKERICFIVDNCILPERLNEYDLIFSKLFLEVEKEAKRRKVKSIYGWDYSENLIKRQKFMKKIGFEINHGFSWYPAGGANLNWKYPFKPKGKVSLWWRFLMKLLEINQKFRVALIGKVPKYISINKVEHSDLKNICLFINKKNKKKLFAPFYSKKKLEEMFVKKNYHGLVAKEENKIGGVLLYFVGAWSGWMFGKPTYTKKWFPFFAYTPFEFETNDSGSNRIAQNMIIELMRVEDPENFKKSKGSFCFFVDAFDEKIKWREKAELNVGCDKVKYDYGGMFVKSLSQKIRTKDYDSIYFPTNLTIVPIPKSKQLV